MRESLGSLYGPLLTGSIGLYAMSLNALCCRPGQAKRETTSQMFPTCAFIKNALGQAERYDLVLTVFR